MCLKTLSFNQNHLPSTKSFISIFSLKVLNTSNIVYGQKKIIGQDSKFNNFGPSMDRQFKKTVDDLVPFPVKLKALYSEK